MEQGAASEEAGGSGKHWEKDSFHPTKAIARDQEKSTESISTRFLVGTGSIRLANRGISVDLIQIKAFPRSAADDLSILAAMPLP